MVVREDHQPNAWLRSGCTKYNDMKKREIINQGCGFQIFQALVVSNCNWNNCLECWTAQVWFSQVCHPWSNFLIFMSAISKQNPFISLHLWCGDTVCGPHQILLIPRILQLSHQLWTKKIIKINKLKKTPQFCVYFCFVLYSIQWNEIEWYKKWREWEAWICYAAFCFIHDVRVWELLFFFFIFFP